MVDTRYNTLYRCAFSKHTPSEEELRTIKELYLAEGSDKIFETIKKRKFVPFVANLLMELGYEVGRWKEVRDSYADRNAKVIEGLDGFFTALDKYGTDRVVVVENFGAFLSAGADPLWGFASGDIDLYGDVNQKDEIYKAATKAGFKFEERYTGKNLISTSFRHNTALPENFYIDIGWYPTARLKIPFLDYQEEAVDWSHTRSFNNTRIRLPDNESLLYICMLHISVHNFSREPDIRLYIDILNCVEGRTIAWNKIIKWAERDGYKNRIATVGYLAHRLVGCCIPDSIIQLCENANHERLLHYIYDDKENALISKPGTIDSLKIEMYANDVNPITGLCEILFPSKRWLQMSYGNIVLVAYFRYIIALLR